MATSTIKANDANIVHSATLASGVTGFVEYVKCGRMVTVHGVISTTSAKTAGAVVASGVPRPLKNWTVGNCISFVGDAIFRIADSGTVNTANAIASETQNIRFAYSYICM